MADRYAAATQPVSVHIRLFDDARKLRSKHAKHVSSANMRENVTFQPELVASRRSTSSTTPNESPVVSRVRWLRVCVVLLVSNCCVGVVWQYDRLHRESFAKQVRQTETFLWECTHDWKTGTRLFHPKVGWAPGTRNPYGIPIGHLLFEKRHHIDDVRQTLQHQKDANEQALHETAYVDRSWFGTRW
jgi:hypothetical protein